MENNGAIAVDSVSGEVPNELRERLFGLFRYAEVGRCVNAVTHDLNNFLGAILAYVELAQMDEGMSAESQRMLNEVVSGVKRSSSLLSALTSIARRDKMSVSVESLSDVVDRAVSLRLYEVKTAQACLDVDLDRTLPAVPMDAPKMEQAVIYLLMNAMEALANSRDKRVIVRTCSAGDLLSIEVWNSGLRLSEEEAQPLFAPFYTSKTGLHLGMGLALVQRVAELHDGHAGYCEDRGFYIRLPERNTLKERMSRGEPPESPFGQL